MELPDRIFELETRDKVSRWSNLRVAHFALNQSTFRQSDVLAPTGLSPDTVSRTVGALRGVGLLRVRLSPPQRRAGKPAALLVPCFDELSQTLQRYNNLHATYLASLLKVDAQTVAARAVESLATVRGIDAPEGLEAVSEALGVHPLTATHLGLMGVAGACDITPLELSNHTPLQTVGDIIRAMSPEVNF